MLHRTGTTCDHSKRYAEKRAQECRSDCGEPPSDRLRESVALAASENASHPWIDRRMRRISSAYTTKDLQRRQQQRLMARKEETGGELKGIVERRDPDG